MGKKVKKTLRERFSSFQIIILGFAGLILFGTFILMLPISSSSHTVTPFNEAIFTATSAVCVTGLVLVDTATHWSYFGQAFILLLIQIGGLGVVTVASLLAVLAGKKISFMQRQTLQNSLSAMQVGGIVKLIRFIIRAVVLIELIGAAFLIPMFVKEYGVEGIWMGFFHSISAFCNAGFDLMGSKSGKFSSLTSFQSNMYATIVISVLIIVGGIGFLTWEDVVKKKFKFKEYRLQSKVAVVTSFFLILIPFVLFFFVDYSNLSMHDRFCSALFQSVTFRTAGFNTADLTELSEPSRALSMVLMLVGGSPGSTAGGMKTTTIAVLFLNAIAVFAKRDNASCFGRRIDDSVVKNAASILFLYLFLAITGAGVISLVEGISLNYCLFETMSAVGTVGLTLGITPGLGIVSQIIIIVLMFFGRVGGLTLIYAAFSKREVDASKYPVENIMVG